MNPVPPVGKTIPVPTKPVDGAAVKTRQERTESAEVEGRHRNTGQKDHKGAR